MSVKEMWAILGICLFLLDHSGSSWSDPGDALSRIASVVKTDLARAYFRQNLDKPQKLNLKEKDRTVKFNLTLRGEWSGVFGDLNRSYAFDGEGIFRVNRNEKASGRDLALESVIIDFRPEEGPVLFQNYFYSQSDSQKLWFTVICYRKGYCQVVVSDEDGKNRFNLQIDTGTAPLEVRFFLDGEEELLLLVVKDPCLVYRWTGTYFDQQNVLDTTGARSVAAFRSGKNSVFVVAQNLGSHKVHSRVYVRKERRTELVQLLPTSNALKAQPFTYKAGEDFSDFVFLLNEATSSSIYWWNGKELSLWKSVDDLLGNRIVHVDHVRSETFLFFSNKRELLVYRPTPMDFDRVLSLTFDSNVIDFDLQHNGEGLPVLIVLTGSEMDPSVQMVAISLEMDYLPVAENQRRERDQILECFKDLQQRLDNRQGKLSESNKVAEALSGTEDSVQIAVLNVGKTLVDKIVSERVVIDPFENASPAPFTEIIRGIADLKNSVESDFGDRNVHRPSRKIYRVRGETKFGKLKANNILVEKLGEKSFRAGNFLSLRENQNLGRVKTGKLSTKDLKVFSVRGVDVQDILVKNRRRQEIIAEQTLKSLKARNVRFGEGGKINGVLFSDLLTHANSEKELVTGRKSFPKFRTQNLAVENIDGISFGNWSAKILPGFKNKIDRDPRLEFSRLNVENLKVSYLNDVPWEDLENSFFFRRESDSLSGSLSCSGKSTVTNLRTAQINGIPAEEFLTKSTEQKLRCGLRGPSAKAKKLKPKSVNGFQDSGLQEILNKDKLYPEERSAPKRIPLTIPNVMFKNSANISGIFINPERMKEIFYFKRTPQEIRIPVHFNQTVTVGKDLNLETIRGEPFYGSTVMRPELIFERATVLGEVSPGEKALRNVHLRNLESNGVKATGENRIHGEKEFQGFVSAKTLTAGFLEPSPFSPRENYQVEEVVLSGAASVRNKANLRNLNGVSFQETVSNLVLTNDPSLLEYGSYSSLLVKYLDVKKLNDLDISFEGESQIDLTIEGNVKTPEIEAGRINDIDFARYARSIVRKNASQVPIEGRKIFLEKTEIFGDLNGTLDGYDAVNFQKKALSKSKPQIVTGIYRVEDAKANSLFAKRVDGIETDNLIFQDDLKFPKIYTDLVFEDLILAGNVRSLDFMDDCDLNKIVEKNLENVQNFGSLDAKEDLMWRNSESESGDLSRLFSDALTSDKDEQAVTGQIVFRGNVFADSVTTKFHVNGIDLKSIADNALYRSLPKQEIFNGVVFKGNVSAENMLVLKNSIVDQVGGIDILDFDSKIVRKDADVKIKGKKLFRNGFSTEKLSADRINGFSTEGIIFYDDRKMIPPTIFEALKVSENLEVGKVDGFDLEHLAAEDWSKIKNETVPGTVTIRGNIRVREDADVSAIDDVVIENVVPLDVEHPETIFGKVEFLNAISIDGRMDAKKVDGHDIILVRRRSFSKDETVEVAGDVVFSEKVSIDGNVEILKEVGKGLAVPNANTEQNEEIFKQRKEIAKVLEKGKNHLSPWIFMYLEEAFDFKLDHSRITGSDLVNLRNGVEIRIKGFEMNSSCGLPKECPCPVHTRVFLSVDGELSVDRDIPRKFKFYDRETGLEVQLETTTASSDPKCSSVKEEETVVIWDSPRSSGRAKLKGDDVEDVKFFRLGDSVYVVVSYASVQVGLSTVVYEITTSDGKVAEVDRVEDSKILDVFWTSEGVVMVTADKSRDFVAIRRFVESENKFSLLRIVPTHGVTDVKSTKHEKENFIFVVQNGSWPLLILKYDPREDNYRVQQKRDTAETDPRADFLSVALLSTSESKNGEGDMFVGIVLSDDSFGLFKYKHVEGFVDSLIQEQDNVKILQPFVLGSEQYLLAASSGRSSKIYKFVKQGR